MIHVGFYLNPSRPVIVLLKGGVHKTPAEILKIIGPPPWKRRKKRPGLRELLTALKTFRNIFYVFVEVPQAFALPKGGGRWSELLQYLLPRIVLKETSVPQVLLILAPILKIEKDLIHLFDSPCGTEVRKKILSKFVEFGWIKKNYNYLRAIRCADTFQGVIIAWMSLLFTAHKTNHPCESHENWIYLPEFKPELLDPN